MGLTGKDLWLAAESHCTARTVQGRPSGSVEVGMVIGMGPPRMERGRGEDDEIYLAAARSRHALEPSPSPAVCTVEGEVRLPGLS
jgi:hypothetical protein